MNFELIASICTIVVQLVLSGIVVYAIHKDCKSNKEQS